MIWQETTLADLASCGDVAVVSVTRPSGYEFVAGQWLRLEIETSEGPQARTLSIASAPQDAALVLATRASSSAFKQTLFRAGRGDPVRVSGPGGRLRLPVDLMKAGMLVGGVGITPARSILRSRWLSGKPFEDVVVFYGNRDSSCIPFDRDLAELVPAGVRIIHVVEYPEASWRGERGRIDAGMVRRLVDAPGELPWLVAGPPPMVTAMEAVLDELGVPVEARYVERFGTSAP